MKRFIFFRGRNASTAVRIVTIVVIVLGAIVTGAVSLILEDILPKTNPEELFVISRWVFLGASLLLVTLAVWLRYEVRSYSGTLFSVQVLDEGVADRLNEGGMDFRLAANRRYMQLRSIRRWVDYEQEIHQGVIDLQELCHEIGVTLEVLINTAADEDRQTIAPNMPWPMAMAVGAYLPARQFNMHVLELPRQENGREHEFPLRYSEEVDTVPSTKQVHQLSGVHGNRVGVLFTLDRNVDPADLDGFRPFGTATVYTVEISSSSVNGEDSAHYVEPALESCGRMIAEELTAIKERHADEELVVSALISPAVALSVGWHLTQHARRLYRGTHLLYFDGDRFVPMRVRPSQPRSCET